MCVFGDKILWTTDSFNKCLQLNKTLPANAARRIVQKHLSQSVLRAKQEEKQMHINKTKGLIDNWHWEVFFTKVWIILKTYRCTLWRMCGFSHGAPANTPLNVVIIDKWWHIRRICAVLSTDIYSALQCALLLWWQNSFCWLLMDLQE